jgi:hypothetical protein
MVLLAGYRALRTENQAPGRSERKLTRELIRVVQVRGWETLKFEIKYGDRRGRRAIIHPTSG